jgi:serine/threonine protein kinase
VDSEARIQILFERWRRLEAEGRPVAPTALCGDCPELAEPLRRRIDRFRLGLADPPLPPATSAPADGPAARDPRFPFLAPPGPDGGLGRLGPYRILDLLGSGGMGLVFRAEEPPPLRRAVALKTIRPEYAGQPAARARFLREARAAARIEHAHVVPLFQVGEADGLPFLTMPLLRGRSLEARLQEAGRLPAAAALRIGAQVAEGLAAAHAAGVIHRDVKPANVWLRAEPDEADGWALLLDFGLARPVEDADGLTAPGTVLGTAGYMAPEQARGEPADARADLFSLGVVLYRMASGRLPFQGPTLSKLLQAMTGQRPTALRALDPALPAGLSDLTARLLAPDPAGRPASAREAAALLRALEASPVAPPTLPHPPPALGLRLTIRPLRDGRPGDPVAAPVLVPRRRDLKRVTPERRRAALRTGDRVRIEASADAAGWLAVLNVGPTGNVTLLYPEEPLDRSSPPRVEAGEAVTVVDVELAPPAGREELYAVWLRRPRPCSTPELLALARDGAAPRRDLVPEPSGPLGPDDWHAVAVEIDHQP